MKRVLTLIAAILIATCLCLPLAACNKIDIKDYPAVRDTYAVTPDDSIPFCDIASAPSDNGSRGFRGEAYIRLGTDEAFPGSGESYTDRLASQMELYAEDGIKVMQVYVYLIDYANCDIPDSAFVQLREYFGLIRSYGIKMLLRFAYEWTSEGKTGPRTADIEGHCKQIKSFIESNRTLFNETVYAVQLGMIGLWGEGHSSVHNLSVKRVIKAVADMVPEDFVIMVRTPEILSKVPDELEHRFGLHDDFLVGYDHEWGMMDWDSEQYPKLLTKCKYTLTDGELPWGAQFDGNLLDTEGIVGQCAGYGLTTLSVEHNYKEDGNEYWLQKCKSEYLDQSYLVENRLPFNPALLTDGKISVYDYLRLHLGYQLVASNLGISDGKASFMLTNYGFAAPHNYTMQVFVDGKQVTTDKAFVPTDLLQFGQCVYTFDYEGGDIEVKIVNLRDENDVVRLFNNVEFRSGRNIIFEAN